MNKTKQDLDLGQKVMTNLLINNANRSPSFGKLTDTKSKVKVEPNIEQIIPSSDYRPGRTNHSKRNSAMADYQTTMSSLITPVAHTPINRKKSFFGNKQTTDREMLEFRKHKTPTRLGIFNDNESQI